MKHRSAERRLALKRLALATGIGSSPAVLRAAEPAGALRRVGIVSLLGDSIRIIAKDPREALFKDVAMDAVAFDAVDRVLQAREAVPEWRHFRAPAEVDVDDQLRIGTAAARRAELPGWVTEAAREQALSHVLLINSSIGVMEFATGLNQVVGDDRVVGIGFVVSAAGRTRNLATGAVTTGYLAPFVQLRLTLLATEPLRVVHSANLSQGYLVAPPGPEADPWQFLSRPEKARALALLIREVATRGAQEVLAAV